MRRSEFEVTDPEAIASVLSESDHGVLSLISGGRPYGVALNFVFVDGICYFHGAPQGRKAEAIGSGARASFLVVRPYAFIPSFFSDSRFACPATQYFASVHMEGRVTPLENPERKALALSALMEKMQPEGGYEPIHVDNSLYSTILAKVGVFALTPETLTLKVKAGQNLSDEKKEALMEKLNRRGNDGDAETASLVESFTREP